VTPGDEAEGSRPATLAERLPPAEESATVAETEHVAPAPEEAAKEDASEARKKVFFPA
jgi:hypothetical protein